MKRPRFVLFDYGETLAHEDDYDPQSGFAAILPYATHNPHAAEPAQMLRDFRECFKLLRKNVHAQGAEMPNRARWKWLFEMLDLEFSLPGDALETIYWDAAAPCVPTPGMPELLRRLRACSIGTGVISNMGFAGASLQNRLERLFPEHRFDFVMSSADYVLRKPDAHLFRLALHKAGCDAGEAWFCGDNPEADIAGAAAVGMTAVYYDCDLGCKYRVSPKAEITLPCLRVQDWSALYDLFTPEDETNSAEIPS